jgi:hypothetical protein
MSGLRAGGGKPRLAGSASRGVARASAWAGPVIRTSVRVASVEYEPSLASGRVCFGTRTSGRDARRKAGAGSCWPYASKSCKCSGRLPLQVACAPVRAGRCASKARRGVAKSEALEGRGRLREERLTFTRRPWRREEEHRVAAERHAGSVRASKDATRLFRYSASHRNPMRATASRQPGGLGDLRIEGSKRGSGVP